ncbi:MAG: prephenate dehydrogenase [Ignavibacterium sp.]|nr:MAG: prephenate dehydrogenase [Ignavibacterium sp.]
MTITIIGLGLIGGSLAIDIKKQKLVTRIIGVDNNAKNAEAALNLGLIDEIAELDKAATDVDFIIIAIPVDQTVVVLDDVLDKISANTVVIDVGSTKERICLTAEQHKNRGNFVATHPIAGTENSGPAAAFSGLFEDKLSIICDPEKSSDFAIEKTESLFRALGMKIIYMRSKEHDLHAAYVSHLSHISSFTLGMTVLEIEKDEETIFELAGSGFESTVRLAKSSPDMWAPIFEQNSEHLSQALDAYIKNLTMFKKLIENKATSKIHSAIEEANDIRRILESGDLFTEKIK